MSSIIHPRTLLLVLPWLALGACKDPVAPMVPACDDAYRPAMCLDGEEECETDDKGCRVCTCSTDDEEAPAE